MKQISKLDLLESEITIQWSLELRGDHTITARCDLTLADMDRAIARARDSFLASLSGAVWMEEATPLILTIRGYILEDVSCLSTTVEVQSLDCVTFADDAARMPVICQALIDQARSRFIVALDQIGFPFVENTGPLSEHDKALVDAAWERYVAGPRGKAAIEAAQKQIQGQATQPASPRGEVAIIVNGHPVVAEFCPAISLKHMAGWALVTTKYDHLASTLWDLRDAEGNLLDENKVLGDTRLPKNMLFMSIKPGVGA